MNSVENNTRRTKNVFAIGGSAGSLPVISKIVARIRPDFDGHLFIVRHVAPYTKLDLGKVLKEESHIPVVTAQHGTEIASGYAYVGVPDRHFLVQDNHIHLTNGPRENRSKPAIDPLFRSAAVAYKSRLTGIILSGNLDDGSAGMLAIKDCGGHNIVQDPETAEYPDMPRNASRAASVEHQLSPEEIATYINDTFRESAPEAPTIPDYLRLEVQISLRSRSDINLQNELGEQVPFICPECKGPLWEMDDARVSRYRCHTGHAYTLETLAAGQERVLEETLWAALRTMEEKTKVLYTLAQDNASMPSVAQTYSERAEESARYTERLRSFLLDFECVHGSDP